MSRHPCKRSTPELSSIAEEYVNYVTENAVPKALTLEKIGEETRKDSALQHVIDAIKNKKQMSPCLFKNKVIDTLIRRKNEMTIYQDGKDCVLVENRIIIPETL